MFGKNTCRHCGIHFKPFSVAIQTLNKAIKENPEYCIDCFKIKRKIDLLIAQLAYERYLWNERVDKE